MNFIAFVNEHYTEILTSLLQHIYLVIFSVLIGILFSMPVGILLSRHKKAAEKNFGCGWDRANHSRTCNVGVSADCAWCGQHPGTCSVVYLFSTSNSAQYLHRINRSSAGFDRGGTRNRDDISSASFPRSTAISNAIDYQRNPNFYRLYC